MGGDGREGRVVGANGMPSRDESPPSVFLTGMYHLEPCSFVQSAEDSEHSLDRARNHRKMQALLTTSLNVGFWIGERRCGW